LFPQNAIVAAVAPPPPPHPSTNVSPAAFELTDFDNCSIRRQIDRLFGFVTCVDNSLLLHNRRQCLLYCIGGTYRGYGGENGVITVLK